MSLPLVSSQILYASGIFKSAPKPEIYLIKMKTNEIRIFCPATIANVSCGFDVLGLASVSYTHLTLPTKRIV